MEFVTQQKYLELFQLTELNYKSISQQSLQILLNNIATQIWQCYQDYYTNVKMNPEIKYFELIYNQNLMKIIDLKQRYNPLAGNRNWQIPTEFKFNQIEMKERLFQEFNSIHKQFRSFQKLIDLKIIDIHETSQNQYERIKIQMQLLLDQTNEDVKQIQKQVKEFSSRVNHLDIEFEFSYKYIDYNLYPEK